MKGSSCWLKAKSIIHFKLQLHGKDISSVSNNYWHKTNEIEERHLLGNQTLHDIYKKIMIKLAKLSDITLSSRNLSLEYSRKCDEKVDALKIYQKLRQLLPHLTLCLRSLSPNSN